MRKFTGFVSKAMIIAATLGLTVSASAKEYLVKYRSPSALQMFSANRNMQITDVHEAGSYMVVNIPENTKVAAMVQLATDPNVQYVVANSKLHTFEAPVEATTLKEQWAIAKVQAEKAWQRAGNKGSKSVVLAVIDTGVDYNHKSLATNMVPGYDFVQNDADPMDITGQNPGHGTHCAGIVAGTGLQDGGIIGLSPELSLMPIRFLDQNGSGDLNNGIKAIDYAIEKGVQIISASWGAAMPRKEAEPLLEAITRAEKAGIIFVVAAANDGKNNDNYEVYPANAGFSNVISVAASDSSDAKPSWSNYGQAKVNVAAPGNAIMSTLPGDKYGNLSGTSMATPLVAGLVALIKAQDPKLTPMQVRSLLQTTGAKVSIQTACDCRVDAFAAVDMVKSQKMFISPAAGTFAVNDKAQFEAVYGKGPFEFTSSAPTVASVDSNGMMTALAEGQTTISVKDSTGASSTSYKIFVGKAGGGGGGGGGTPAPDPGNPPGGGGECPIGDPQMCQIICQVMPDAPWCKTR
jgi:thermitase